MLTILIALIALISSTYLFNLDCKFICFMYLLHLHVKNVIIIILRALSNPNALNLSCVKNKISAWMKRE